MIPRSRTCVRCCVALAFLLSGILAGAQEPEVPRRELGDIITLTTGAQMSGVRVVRKTATNYKVEIVDGVVMEIPVSQVSDIDYAERHPARGARTTPGAAENGAEIRAQEMDPGLNSVLTAPLEEPLNFGEQDALRILDLIAEMFGFELEVHESVRELSAAERAWRVELAAGTTLLRFFRDDLPARFPALVAVPRFDRVYLTTRQDAEAEGLVEPTAVRGENSEDALPDGQTAAPSP